ncbi:hypothetical protein J4050_13205 [Winogradskyella sp. DF17]|jgi:hypothetical protein|uniref:Uncharacterized protein n=1 Tax=Winogradskyella pelagia TaxID=2819984 RepID=A0ABS3T4L8_9FLAO|nr:hypothetical protein [Winogradskyella sp. DF17]MBO3117708.1 hypothetical protein [Winogradskyella sp. DF17]
MGIFEDNRKFKRTKEQNNPVNPNGIAKKSNTNEFDIDKDTIKNQQNKK